MPTMNRAYARTACAGIDAQWKRRAMWMFATGASIIATLAISASADAAIMSDFATDDDGWVAMEGTAQWAAAPGGGYLLLTGDGGAFTEAAAPSKFIDSLFMYRNGTISLDARVFTPQPGSDPLHPSDGPPQFVVRVTIDAAGYEDGPSSAYIDLAGSPDMTRLWQSFIAPMTAGAWGLTNGEWNALLLNATGMRISIIGPNILPPYEVGFDNVMLVPTPGGAALAAGALALCVVRRRRAA